MTYVAYLAFVLFGAAMFYVGSRAYREYRLFADTPLLPVGNIRAGLVRVHGRATGDDRLSSPLTRVPCFYFCVEVKRWVERNQDSQWETIAGEKGERLFYLDDGTGRVPVDPHGADYRGLPQTFRAEMRPNSIHKRFVEPSLGVMGPSDEDLRGYISAYYARRRAEIDKGITAAVEAKNAIAEIPYEASVNLKKAMGKVLAADEWLESKGLDVDVNGGLTIQYRAHTYRFTEHCLLADRECNVFGTCVENPSPKDYRGRNLIKKGEDEESLVVSLLSEKLTWKALRRRALLYFLIGAALIIIGVFFTLRDTKIL